MAPLAHRTHSKTRRRVLVIGCLVVVLSLAVLVYRTGAVVCTPSGTTTAILQLCKPAFGESSWATAINANWDLLDSFFGIGNILKVANGGTGLSSPGPSGNVLTSNGTAWVSQAAGGASGLVFDGPTSVGAGSTRSHEGDVTISSNTTLGGVHYYEDFTLNASTVLTIDTADGFIAVVASKSITVNGTIEGEGKSRFGLGGAGSGGGAGGGGADGTDQPGGNGGGGDSSNCTGGAGGAGGAVKRDGFTIQPGGAGTISGSRIWEIQGWTQWVSGGAGGGGGGNGGFCGTGGSGGRGGGTIILIAPTITLGSGAILRSKGGNGGNASPNGDGPGNGGGGGAGNIWMLARTYTDNGATFILAGGSVGSGGIGGSAGAAGVRQILLYN